MTKAQNKLSKTNMEIGVSHGCSACLDAKAFWVSLSIRFSPQNKPSNFNFLIHELRITHVGFEHMV